jgi:hypothetical protein
MTSGGKLTRERIFGYASFIGISIPLLGSVRLSPGKKTFNDLMGKQTFLSFSAPAGDTV